jgi:hypothetical protein
MLLKFAILRLKPWDGGLGATPTAKCWFKKHLQSGGSIPPSSTIVWRFQAKFFDRFEIVDW